MRTALAFVLAASIGHSSSATRDAVALGERHRALAAAYVRVSCVLGAVAALGVSLSRSVTPI